MAELAVPDGRVMCGGVAARLARLPASRRRSGPAEVLSHPFNRADASSGCLTFEDRGKPVGPAASGHGARVGNPLRATAATATFPEAVRENEEVVPVNAVSTWVLPSGVMVGR